MTAETPYRDRFLSIHYLRGVAAIMVVTYHVFSYHLIEVVDPLSAIWLKNGIGIFFVISGFVMVASTAQERPAIRTFLVRRVRRVVPLYWLMTALFALAAGTWHGPDLFRSLFFIPIFAEGSVVERPPILNVGWTLNYEMAFYLLFALSMPLPRTIAIWGLSLFLIFLALPHGLLPLDPPLRYYAAPYWGDFAAGMLIAHLRLRAPRWGIPVGFILLALLPRYSDFWLTSVTLPAALVVASARTLDGTLARWPLAMLLGDASYAIYLTHIFVLLPLLALPGMAAHPVPMFLLAMGGSVAAGVIVHLFIEKPLMGRQALREQSPSQALA